MRERTAASAHGAADGLPIVRQVIRRALARLFGARSFDTTTDRGDPGLTGPGSGSWQVMAEPAAIAGGIRGLLLQSAHPLAMAGVHEHSAFRADPLGRLHRTSAYVTTITFGSSREALEVTERVRRVHPHVRGRAPDGRTYRAEDPHLLAWVSVALTSSFLEADRCWAPHPVTGTVADGFVREQSRLAALLDPRVDLEPLRCDPTARDAFVAGEFPLPMLQEGELPSSVAELELVLASFEDELGIGPQGREALRFLERPPLPLGVTPAYEVLRRGAVGSLRPTQRAVLGYEMDPVTARRRVAAAGLLLTGMRISSGTSPSERLARERTSGTDPQERERV